MREIAVGMQVAGMPAAKIFLFNIFSTVFSFLLAKFVR